MDDEWAEAVEKLYGDRDDDGERSTTAEEWTREQDTLALIADYLQAIRSTLIAAHSANGRGPSVKPLPRPTTALEKAQRKRAKRAHEERVRKLVRPAPEPEDE